MNQAIQQRVAGYLLIKFDSNSQIENSNEQD